MKKSAYLKAGGMDEGFVGWGGEDDAMSLKLQQAGVKMMTNSQHPGYHLWHPRTDNYEHPDYIANRNRLNQLYLQPSRKTTDQS